MPASSWSPGAAVKAAQILEKEERAEAGAGGTYLRRLREEFFVRDVNIAKRGAQLSVAESIGLSASAMEDLLDDGRALAALFEDHQERERLRIQGSPTYVFEGGRAMLYGNFPFGILHATVEELVRGRDPGGSAC